MSKVLVSNIEQIKNNIETFFEGMNSDKKNTEYYKGLIKNGACFVVFEKNERIGFIPSRFVGYNNNTIEVHKKNSSKDGRETNKAISKILGIKPYNITEAEYAYKEFCTYIGIGYKPKGQLAPRRKYWILDEYTQEFIDIYFGAKKNEFDDLEDIKKMDIKEVEKKTYVNARIGQGKYRANLISIWKQCPITGSRYLDILKASHIKPWIDSNNQEKLDPYNGILLSPLYDSLFDKGLISFSDDGKMLISNVLPESERKCLSINTNKKISFNKKSLVYLEFHRKVKFKK